MFPPYLSICWPHSPTKMPRAAGPRYERSCANCGERRHKGTAGRTRVEPPNKRASASHQRPSTSPRALGHAALSAPPWMASCCCGFQKWHVCSFLHVGRCANHPRSRAAVYPSKQLQRTPAAQLSRRWGGAAGRLGLGEYLQRWLPLCIGRLSEWERCLGQSWATQRSVGSVVERELPLCVGRHNNGASDGWCQVRRQQSQRPTQRMGSQPTVLSG